MGFNEDAIRAAEKAERAAREAAAQQEAAAAAQRATHWRNLEAESRKEAASWFREMGVTSPPAIDVLDRFSFLQPRSYPSFYRFGIVLGWHLDGHDFKAKYTNHGPSFDVFIKINVPGDSGDGSWRDALTKIQLGQALLAERRGQGHSR